MQEEIPHNPPPGFRRVPIEVGFIEVNGPLWVNVTEPQLRLGLRVEMRHCNPMGIAHGGMLATFIDMVMPFAIIWQTKMPGRFLPTIHLSQDYLAPAPKGCWLEGRGEVLRVTKNMVFAQCIATADGQPCLRANGIFKLGQEIPGIGLSALLAQMGAEATGA